jgi:hypothetical protein
MGLPIIGTTWSGTVNTDLGAPENWTNGLPDAGKVGLIDASGEGSLPASGTCTGVVVLKTLITGAFTFDELWLGAGGGIGSDATTITANTIAIGSSPGTWEPSPVTVKLLMLKGGS